MTRTSTLVISMHALPENLVPYYLSYLVSFVRMLMTLFIVGPPKAQKKKQDPMWKTAAMVVFLSGLLGMAVSALVIDSKLLYTEAHSKLELLTRCIVVIVTSLNFINAFGKQVWRICTCFGRCG